MCGRVHQEDKTKLKATVDVADDQAIEVTQADASKLKGTVTQLAKDRTVTGTVTCIQSSGHLHKVEASQDPFVEYQVSQGTAANLKATVTQLAKDRTVTNATAANLKAEVSQGTASSLKVEAYQQLEETYRVDQTAKDRTVTNATAANLKCEPTQTTAANLKATVTQIPLSTMLSSAITLTNADTAYKLPASEQSGRSILVIYNISDATVYIGGSGVTTAAGMPLASSKYMVVPASANVYAVCGAAGKILRLSECK